MPAGPRAAAASVSVSAGAVYAPFPPPRRYRTTPSAHQSPLSRHLISDRQRRTQHDTDEDAGDAHDGQHLLSTPDDHLRHLLLPLMTWLDPGDFLAVSPAPGRPRLAAGWRGLREPREERSRESLGREEVARAEGVDMDIYDRRYSRLFMPSDGSRPHSAGVLAGGEYDDCARAAVTAGGIPTEEFRRALNFFLVWERSPTIWRSAARRGDIMEATSVAPRAFRRGRSYHLTRCCET